MKGDLPALSHQPELSQHHGRYACFDIYIKDQKEKDDKLSREIPRYENDVNSKKIRL